MTRDNGEADATIGRVTADVRIGVQLQPQHADYQQIRETVEQANGQFLEPAVRIAFPPDRAEIDVEDDDSGNVVIKAEDGALPLTWLLDGVPIDSDPGRRDVDLAAGRGFHKISVIDAKGRADRVTMRLK